MKDDTSIATDNKCNQCGSPLVLVTEKTTKIESNFSHLTVTTYICSNKVCQEDIDKRKAKQAELRAIQTLARENKLKAMKRPAAS